MRIFLSLFFLLIYLNSFAENEKKEFFLKNIDKEIKIDGKIDKLWSLADSVSDFVQFQPFHGKEPFKKTTAKLITNNTSLYCLIICFDQINNIQNFDCPYNLTTEDLLEYHKEKEKYVESN